MSGWKTAGCCFPEKRGTWPRPVSYTHLHVYPDLVGAAGFQLAADVGIALISADDLPVGHGGLGIALGDAHFLDVYKRQEQVLMT